jgi:hypothetical protein
VAGSLLLYYTAAILSVLNLAIFSLSRLRLETASRLGDQDAMRVLVLRHWCKRSSHFSLMGSWYILSAHPEDRALLESNLNAAAGG